MRDYPSIILCILDGWGYRENGIDNSISNASTPHWDKLWSTCPHSLLEASAETVGLPKGQMGNSEVGHMNLGAGRVIYQTLPRIDKAIETNNLRSNSQLKEFVHTLKTNGKTCHLMGLFSPGGIHSHQRHILELAQIVIEKGIPVTFHAFLDGRDTPPKSATTYLEDLQEFCDAQPLATVGTVSGRYYAMDRDNRWERTQLAYEAMSQPQKSTPRASSPIGALEDAYNQGITDEFVLPTAMESYIGMQDGDGLLAANFRADRMRQTLEAFLDTEFNHFTRAQHINFSAALGAVEYSTKHNQWMNTLFPSEQPDKCLGQIIAEQGLKQLRAAETEKYAHVTFFFNGGREAPFPFEDRTLIPSPKVATYDLQPEMSAPELTANVVEAIHSQDYALIVVNYANTDMVGHTGNQAAAEKAVEAVDDSLGKIMAAVEATHSTLIITADHGNVEVMNNPQTAEPHTAHTMNPVPLVIFGQQVQGCTLENGILADVAPTVLDLLKISQPLEMTGKSLLKC
jgi:2,3-bisphosphoglycerate-independent phosphoglycerate mutase